MKTEVFVSLTTAVMSVSRSFIPFAVLCALLALSSCGDNEGNNINVPTEEVIPGTNHKVLVAYFSEPLPDGVDASTSASRLIVNGDLYGSVEYMATVISEATGADTVRIRAGSGTTWQHCPYGLCHTRLCGRLWRISDKHGIRLSALWL